MKPKNRSRKKNDDPGLSLRMCEAIPGFGEIAASRRRDLANWRHRGTVPWYVVGPLLLSWFEDERGPVPPREPEREITDARWDDAYNNLRAIFLNATPEMLAGIVENLGVFAFALHRGYRRELAEPASSQPGLTAEK